MNISELSENIKNILEEAQQISAATAQAKSMMDMSEVQLQNYMTIYDDMIHQLMESYNENESLLQISEVQNNITEDFLEDNRILREEAERMYTQYTELNNEVISYEQLGEMVEKKSIELDKTYLKQEQIIKKQINDFDEEILKEENKLIHLKHVHDEYRSLLHEVNAVKSDLKNIAESDNIPAGELNVSEILESCQMMEKELTTLAGQQEDIDRKIEEKTSYIQQKLIEKNTILEKNEPTNICESVDIELSELKHDLSNTQSHEKELLNVLKTIVEEINENESKLENIEREKTIITDTVKSTVTILDEQILTYNLSVTKKREDVHKEHDRILHHENDLKDLEVKIAAKRQELQTLSTFCEKQLQDLTEMKQTQIQLMEESNTIPNEDEKLKEEIKNAKHELDLIEQQPHTIIKEYNDEILKVNETKKSNEEQMKEKLNESQKKVNEIETLNNDTYNKIGNYETKLEGIKKRIVESGISLSKDYEILKGLDAEYENVSADIKVLQIKKSSKTIPKTPYAYFATPSIQSKIIKPQNMHQKDLPGNMSDTSTEGERMTYAEYLRRKNTKGRSRKTKRL